MKKMLSVLIAVSFFLSSIVTDGYAMAVDSPVSDAQSNSSANKAIVHDSGISDKEYVPGEILVKFKDGADPSTVLQSHDIKAPSLDRVHSIKSAAARFKKDYKLEKDSESGWYPFLGKNYKEISDIPDEEVFAQAYVTMPEKEKDIYRTYKMKVPEGMSVEETVDKLKQDPDVEYAEPNYIARVQMAPNDPYYYSKGSLGQAFDDLWGVKKVGCESAWDTSQGEGIVVAVIDTGVDYNHPDIWDNIWVNPATVTDRNSDGKIDLNDCDLNGNHMIEPNEIVPNMLGYDFINNDNDPKDGYGHGTHCAGTIAGTGNNGIGVIGVAPKARIMVLKGLDDEGSGPIETLARAVVYAADNGAKVLSNSWGGVFSSQALIDAFHYADSKGCVCIAAAGNENSDAAYFSPASIDTVIAVAAVTYTDERASFSNYGLKVDVAAPGKDILSLRASGTDMYKDGAHFIPNGDATAKYYRCNGTSMACPHAAGVAALILKNKPDWKPAGVSNCLKESASLFGADVPSPDRNIGTGIVNAARAVTVDTVSDGTARITAPAAGQKISGIVEIKGLAYDDNFEKYTLSYASVGSKAWKEFYCSTSPVDTEGILCTDGFDTGMAWGRDINIKLEVIDTNKKVSRAIANLALELPDVIRSVIDNGVIGAGGTVFIKGDMRGYNAQSYSVDYGIQSQPSSSDYMVQSQSSSDPASWVNIVAGATPPANDILARWDTSSITPGVYCTLRISLHKDGEDDLVQYVRNIYMDPSIKEGWPQRLELDKRDDGIYVYPGRIVAAVADLEGDGKKEIVTYRHGLKPALTVFRCDGSLLWSVSVGKDGDKVDSGELNVPLIADIDGDNMSEIIVFRPDYVFSPGSYVSKIYAFRNDGTLVKGWPVDMPSDHKAVQENPALSAADLDLDGQDEVVVAPQIASPRKIAVIKGSGAIAAQWDIVTPPNTFYNLVSWYPAIGNLDGDPEPEIVLLSWGGDYSKCLTYIYACNRDGTQASGKWPAVKDGYPWGSPVIGDIDGDGNNEIIAVTGPSLSNDTGISTVYALGNSGNELWKVAVKGSITGSPALSDLDNDGKAEIVVPVSGKAYVISYKGELLYNPLFTAPYSEYYSFSIADMDSDESPDIVSCAADGVADKDYNVCAWNNVGATLSGFPKVTGMKTDASAIDDIDNDGMLEMVSVCYRYNDSSSSENDNTSSVYVWKLGTVYMKDRMDWPMFQHDPKLSGCYAKRGSPISLIISGFSTKKVSLSWTYGPMKETPVIIERKTGPGGTYAAIATLSSGSASYDDTGVVANATYYYRARVSNSAGKPEYSNEVSVTTTLPAPNAPSDLKATKDSATQVSLSWTDNSADETAFVVEKKEGVSGTYSCLATLPPNTIKYTDMLLKADTPYFYRVRASNDGLYSAYSNEADTYDLPPKPAAPSGLNATAISATEAYIAWNDNSNNENAFILERKEGLGGVYKPLATLGTNYTSYNDTTVKEDATYYYRVRASNYGSYSEYSNEAGLYTTPAAPSELAAAASGVQINLSWRDNSKCETAVSVERKIGSAGTYASLAALPAGTTSYGDLNIEGKNTYYYRVRSANNGSYSGYSNEANVTSNLPPAAPTNLAIGYVSGSKVSLSWKDNSTGESNYYVERKEGAAGTFAVLAALSANAISYDDTSVKEFTAYSYRVRASSSGLYSTYSNETSCTTLFGEPSNLVAVPASATQVNLAWRDNSNNEQRFVVERKTGDNGTYQEVAFPPANATNYSDKDLYANTKYSYRLYAVNGASRSEYSSQAVTMTPQAYPAPCNLTGYVMSESDIRLVWSCLSTAMTSFTIERKTGSAGAYSVMATLPPTTPYRYEDTSVKKGTEYYYRMRASYGTQKSVYSDETSVMCSSLCPAAPQIYSVRSSITSSGTLQVAITWTRSPQTGANSPAASNYILYRKVGGYGVSGSFDVAGSCSGAATSFIDTNSLSANTVYSYKMVAISASGYRSPYSCESSSVTTPAKPIETPSNLVASAASSAQINLTWKDNSSSEQYFVLERKAGVSGNYAQVGFPAANSAFYSDKGLDPGTLYYYRLSAYAPAGCSSLPSTETSASTLTAPPAAPSALKGAYLTSTKIALTWSNNSATATPVVERKAGVSGSYKVLASLPASAASYTDENVTEGARYFYRVCATNKSGSSGYSNEIDTLQFPANLFPPTEFKADKVTGVEVSLSWKDNSTGEAAFIVERRPASGGAYSPIITLPANTVSCKDASGAESTGYYYRIKAVDAAGSAAYSGEIAATTSVAAPSDLVVTTSLGAKYVDVTFIWKDNSAKETGYSLEMREGTPDATPLSLPLPANSTGYILRGVVKQGTAYYFRVSAVYPTGYMSSSQVKNITPLAAPCDVRGYATDSTQAGLNWIDQTENEERFVVERRTGDKGSYVVIGYSPAGSMSYLDKGLTPGTKYYYRVRASNPMINSPYSGEVSLTTPLTATAPTDLAVNAVSGAKIILSWKDNCPSEASYILERKTGAGIYFTVATLPANTEYYEDSGVKEMTTYGYRVRAMYNPGSYSEYSNEVAATTPAALPAAPSNLAYRGVPGSKMTLFWVDNSVNETGFILERKTGYSGEYSIKATLPANYTSYEDSGLSESTIYLYRVRASGSAGYSEYSNELIMTTAPNPPSGLAARAVSASKISLSWTDNSTGETSFILERKTGSAVDYSPMATLPANTTSYDDTTVAEGTTYFYRIQASFGPADSAFSNEVTVSTPIAVPVAPSALTAKALSDSKVSLSWADNSANEKNFILERRTGTSGAYACIATLSPGVTSYDDAGVAGNTTYYYRVRASNSTGYSAYSNEANVTTPIPVPAAPTGLVASSVLPTQVNVSWKDNSTNEASFILECKVSSYGTYSPTATLPPNTTSYSVTGVCKGLTYFFRVRASNASGYSAYSNEITVTTPNPPAPPSYLRITNIYSNKVSLEWDCAIGGISCILERRTGETGSYAVIATLPVSPSGTKYDDTAVVEGTAYYYRVYAVNKEGNSDYTYSINNASTLLASPSSFAVTQVAGGANLTWKDNSSKETVYLLERQVGCFGSYVLINNGLPANSTSFKDVGYWARNTQISYRITALKNTGGTAVSVPVETRFIVK